MNIYAISDLHLSSNCDKPMDIFGSVWDNYWELIQKDWQEKVNEEDIVLIPGDISWGMTLTEALSDLQDIAKLKGRKVFIRGNHDYWWSGIGKIRAILPPNMYCIQNDAIRFDEGIVLCGSRGWTIPDVGVKPTDEDKKILDREIIRMEMSLKQATKLLKEEDELIAMVHFPPFNARIENSALTNLFSRYGVSKVVYGHLHGGNSRANLRVFKPGVEYFLTSCDLVGNVLTKISER